MMKFDTFSKPPIFISLWSYFLLKKNQDPLQSIEINTCI